MARCEDEALYGGAAGGGKSDALVIEALRQVDVPNYRALILRKTFPQLRERLKKLGRLFRAMLALYLDDLLMLAGCACFVSGAAIKWGAAEALGVCGVCLTVYAVIVARGGIGRR